MNSEMNSSDAKLEEIGPVLERGGTDFGQVKLLCDVRSEESNDSFNEDHNYTRSESEKNDTSFNLEMKHSVALCDEVNKVIKHEETVPDWEFELSDSNDSKENVPKLVVKVDNNPQPEVQEKRDVNSNNKPKSQFKLRNILPIPPNILIEKLLPSRPVQNDAQSTSDPPNKFPSSDSNKIQSVNPVPMVPSCSLKKNNVSQVRRAEPVGSGHRISQSHPKKEQWVVQEPSLAKSDPQAMLGGHRFGSDQNHQFEHGHKDVPSKKLRQSISIQNAKMIPSTFQNSSNQVMRPGAAQVSPAVIRQVSPAAMRQASPALIRQVAPAVMRQVRPAQPRQQPGLVPIPGSRRAASNPIIRQTRFLPMSSFPPPPRNTNVPSSRYFPSSQQMQLTQLPVQMPHAPAMSSTMRAPISHHQYQYSPVAASYRMIPPIRFVGLPDHPQVRNLPDYPQGRDLPPSISISRVRCSSMPEVPLGTLASALAGLGKLEGDKVMVQYTLTMGQIEALKTLGIKKEDGHEVLNVE